MSLEQAVPIDDQPIKEATLFFNDKWLREWVTPDNLQVQDEYQKLTNGLADPSDRVLACFNRVLSVPYTEAVKVKVSVDGITITQNDAWLEPGQALMTYVDARGKKRPIKLNCANRSFLLASLLRQEYPPDKVWVVLGNLNMDGLGGHAWVMLRSDQDYILETTSPNIRYPISADSPAHEDIIYFNDKEVRAIPDRKIREPFSKCWCHPLLEDYLDKRQCYNL